MNFLLELKFFNLRRRRDIVLYGNRVTQFLACPAANLHLCIDFVCNLLAQIIKFAFGHKKHITNTPLHHYTKFLFAWVTKNTLRIFASLLVHTPLDVSSYSNLPRFQSLQIFKTNATVFFKLFKDQIISAMLPKFIHVCIYFFLVSVLFYITVCQFFLLNISMHS